jgi:hypothetical protein
VKRISYYKLNSDPAQIVIFPQMYPDINNEKLLTDESIRDFKKRIAKIKYTQFILNQN